VINYEVKSGYSKAKAERTVFREAEKINNIIKEILNEFPLQKRSLIQVLKWEDIETENYKFMVKILYQEFNKNDKFRNIIIDIVKENIKSLNLTDSDYEKLAEYVLNELPMLISGVEYKGILYELLPYPGISKIDYLAIDLQEGKTFEKINKKLKIKNKLRIIEAYAK
jgi:tRNA-dependent cyclodipeptide synthase